MPYEEALINYVSSTFAFTGSGMKCGDFSTLSSQNRKSDFHTVSFSYLTSAAFNSVHVSEAYRSDDRTHTGWPKINCTFPFA